ncbi:hypothetical protein HBB16_12690 [Pseudonocardia sp. MCCB 268]|nr:hypothetical protein [Pseudonocardia cytotoxica]
MGDECRPHRARRPPVARPQRRSGGAAARPPSAFHRQEYTKATDGVRSCAVRRAVRPAPGHNGGRRPGRAPARRTIPPPVCPTIDGMAARCTIRPSRGRDRG